jgi:hypothetical protein
MNGESDSTEDQAPRKPGLLYRVFFNANLSERIFLGAFIGPAAAVPLALFGAEILAEDKAAPRGSPGRLQSSRSGRSSGKDRGTKYASPIAPCNS